MIRNESRSLKNWYMFFNNKNDNIISRAEVFNVTVELSHSLIFIRPSHPSIFSDRFPAFYSAARSYPPLHTTFIHLDDIHLTIVSSGSFAELRVRRACNRTWSF